MLFPSAWSGHRWRIVRRLCRQPDSPSFFDGKALRDVTELPVIGTVSLIHNEARTRRNAPVFVASLLRQPGWSLPMVWARGF
jgi:hypothetical protein